MKVINLLILMMILVSSLSLAGHNSFLYDTNVTYRPAPRLPSYPAIVFDGTNHFIVGHDLHNTTHYYCHHGEATADRHIFGCRVIPQSVLPDSAGVFISCYVNM